MTEFMTNIGIINGSQKPPEWYDMIYSVEDTYWKPVWESGLYNLYLRMCARILPGERVIDFGCGTGQLAQLMVETGKNFILGLDFSPVAIDYAKQLLPKHDFVVADLYKPDTYENLPDYDCITMSEVMEHLEKDLVVLNSILPDTHLIFTVPNYAHESHVRGFRNEDEIRERYEKYMEFNGLEEFMMDEKNNLKVWIVDSVIK